MIRIVTVEREFGSGGGGIACELSRRLGWKLWDNELTSGIAKSAQVAESAVALCDERVDGRLYRLAKAFWRGSYERSIPFGQLSCLRHGPHDAHGRRDHV